MTHKAEKIEDYVNAVSHDLKNPLTSVKAYAQLARNKLLHSGDTDTAGYIEKIEEHTERALLLIAELLDTERMREGNVILQKRLFSLDKLITNTAQDFSITTTHTIKVQGIIGSKIKADKEKIQRVLDNLLSNAIKYSPKANKVIVNREVKNKEVIISIEDFGLGIPPRKQKNLFAPYYRVREGKKSQVKGYGLGLPVVKRFIELHGGKVWLESKSGKGSIFYFSLPLQT